MDHLSGIKNKFYWKSSNQRSPLLRFLGIAILFVLAITLGNVIVSTSSFSIIIYTLGGFVLIASVVRVEIALLALLFIMPLTWFHIPLTTEHVYALNIGNVLFVWIFICWLLRTIVRKEGYTETPLNYIILTFFLIVLAGLARSLYVLPQDYARLNIHWFFKLMQHMFIFYLVINVFKNKRDVKYCVLIMIIPILIIAGIVSIQSHELVSQQQTWAGAHEIEHPGAGGSGDTNTTASFIAMMTPIIIGLFLFTSSRINGLFLAAASGLCLYAIIYTFSRGSYLAIVGGLAIIFLIKDRRLLALLIIGLILWTWWLPDVAIDRILYTFVPGEGTKRPLVWKAAFQTFLHHPFLGVGWSIQHYKSVLEFGVGSHSFYLRILAELGLLGFGLFILLQIYAFKTAWYVFKNDNERFFQGLALGFMGSLGAITVHGFVGWSLLLGPMMMYFFTLLGLIVVAKKILEAKNTLR